MSSLPEIKRAARRVLNSPDGEVLMAAIAKKTVARSSLNTSATDGTAMALLMAVREGENSLYRWIESLRQQEDENA